MSHGDGGWKTFDPVQLADAFDHVDPPPEALAERLRKAFDTRHRDAELCHLTVETAGRADAEHAESEPVRTFRFESARCVITATLSQEKSEIGDHFDLTGEVDGATPAAVVLETPSTTTRGAVEGQAIRATGVGNGPIRVCVIMDDAGNPWMAETEWVTV